MTNGGVVVGDWMDKVSTLVEAWLPGQGGPEAIVDVLTGVVSPSGRLTETIARREADYPSFLHFPGEHHSVRYAEGIFVGYRGFDAVDRDVAFPFGHGLSYTNFSYSNLAVMPQGDSFLCTLEVTNTGNRSGHEVVQVYTGLSSSAVPRAPRELKGVSVVYLAPGETTSVTISLSRQDLSYYDVRVHDWVVEPGSYNVFVGASSRDIRLQTAVDVAGDEVDIPLTANSTFAEWLHNPRGAAILASLLEKSPAGVVDAARADVTFWAMLQEFRLAQALNFLMVPLDIAAMEDALRQK
jgi:beta-glucosidase